MLIELLLEKLETSTKTAVDVSDCHSYGFTDCFIHTRHLSASESDELTELPEAAAVSNSLARRNHQASPSLR